VFQLPHSRALHLATVPCNTCPVTRRSWRLASDQALYQRPSLGNETGSQDQYAHGKVPAMGRDHLLGQLADTFEEAVLGFIFLCHCELGILPNNMPLTAGPAPASRRKATVR